MKKIVAFKVLENYRVWLRFNDSVAGEIDFSGKSRTGVFAIWNDYDFFRKACLTENGALTWPGELDFCPNALWLQITGKTLDELSASEKLLTPENAHA